MSQTPVGQARHKIHPGWGRPLPGAKAPLPAPASESKIVRRSRVPDYYAPVDDPGISLLVNALDGPIGIAPVIVLEAADGASGSLWPTRLRGQTGWLMVARHRLLTLGTVTEHYVFSAICDSKPSLHPEAGLALARCSFQPADRTTDATETVIAALRQGLQRQTPRFARKRHEANVAHTTNRIAALTDRLAELDREIDNVRASLRGFLRRTDAYMARQDELDRLLREDRKVFVERRKLRAGQHVTINSHDETHESLEPIGIVRWSFEP